MTLRLPALLGVTAIALTLCACGSSGAKLVALEGTTTGAGMTIELRGPEVPSEGDNTFEVAVRKDGSPIADADVAMRFSMPAMPAMNMPEMHANTLLTAVGNGVYRGTGRLSMAGTWNIEVQVARHSEELGTKRLSIVSR